MQFNGRSGQPQLRAASDAQDGAACVDPGEDALPICLEHERCAQAQRSAARLVRDRPARSATVIAEFNVNGHKLYLLACKKCLFSLGGACQHVSDSLWDPHDGRRMHS